MNEHLLARIVVELVELPVAIRNARSGTYSPRETLAERTPEHVRNATAERSPNAAGRDRNAAVGNANALGTQSGSN
jgi:hypothetical protein